MSLPEAIQHVEEFLRDNLETESCNTQHEELLGFLKELQARRSTPLYTPVKPEDVTPGWYWAVSQSGVVTVCEAMGHSLFFIRKESMIFSEYSVKTILDRGYTLYRIPELEVSE